MLDVEWSQLERALADLQSQLRDGLVAADILDLTTRVSLVSFNANPEASAQFVLMTEQLNRMLEEIMYPGINRYVLLDLESDHSAVVVRSGADMLLVMLVDNTRTTLGMLLAVAVPGALETLAAARR
ncbi:MAG: hypothetical protein ACYC1E_13390 [Propionibacteriaceae bacterium]